MEFEYILSISEEEANQLSRMAENAGYDCDLTYLKDCVTEMIAGNYFRLAPLDIHNE